MGWSLAGLRKIERFSARKGVPRYDVGDVFYLDGQELVPCTTANVSVSCAYGGTHFAKVENFERITYAATTNEWRIHQKNGNTIFLKSLDQPRAGLGGLRRGESARRADRLFLGQYQFGHRSPVPAVDRVRPLRRPSHHVPIRSAPRPDPVRGRFGHPADRRAAHVADRGAIARLCAPRLQADVPEQRGIHRCLDAHRGARVRLGSDLRRQRSHRERLDAAGHHLRLAGR
jgi:hypothetical protein